MDPEGRLQSHTAMGLSTHQFSNCLHQQQQYLEREQPPGFAALLQQPLLQPVYEAQQLQQLQQQGRAFAVAPVKGPNGEDRGLGFVALRDLPAGFVVYEDFPLLSLQHSVNKCLVKACCRCRAPLGDAVFQLLHFFSAVPESYRRMQSLLSINRDWLLRLQQEQQQQEVVPCPAGCGEAFCSVRCLDSDAIHRQLCVGRLSEEAPLVAFKRFALEHCENLLLAAAAIVSAAAAAAAQPGDMASNEAEVAAAALQLLRLLLQHQHGQWQEENEPTTRVRLMEEEMDEETEEETELSRKDIVERGSSLLLLGLQELSAAYVHLISPSLVSELLSLFEHCNSDLEVPNPLNAFFGFCLSGAKVGGAEELQLLLAEKEAALADLFGEEHEDDDANSNEGISQSLQTTHTEAAGEAQELRKLYVSKPLSLLCPPPIGRGRPFPAVKQTAFFCSIARINHSCAPNMEMECTHPPHGGKILLKLVRNVQQGEELCISYVKDLPLTQRQLRRQRLEEFGFECTCHYCASGL
ncbi:histone-lysine N-methyltransferase, putative [Eimeria acervulina]|uniref:Histone-lysine N-methyltransferase, putative n=1 Tax=Eimeria acervulina TaxID=5801 RepID=U6GQG7_EIMAC|nr:histone-lysine N-methyltransferase, putative [Eimeria acervulina]CDI82440.1 histone-lysine N-methyltransferase, putative [Eimeria acervulina]